MLAAAREQLDALDRAAARIDAGTYGVCEHCGRTVGDERTRGTSERTPVRRLARRTPPERRGPHRSESDPEEGRGESRDGVALTNLDQPLFDGAEATKRDLVDYLDGVRDRIIPVLEDRPLSVIRVHRGQEAFMQKNVPKYTPDWVRTVTLWAETSKRDVSYALCNDRRDAAVVRQPARGGVPPDARARPTARTA